ncbi:MAG: PEP-CTERM sorting domain-containing protein [Thermoguttaceae bacterium]|jgi:hypothetical protein
MCTRRESLNFDVMILSCLLALAVLVSTAAASDDTSLSWNYQQTGFRAYGSSYPQTAVAMRDGQVWPVVFSEDSYHKVQAYSLYPVKNPITLTNWYQIGTNLITDSDSGILSAATSPDGRFGVALTIVGSANSAAVVGSSLTGFSGAMTGVQAIDFDRNGNLIKGTLTTLPVINGVSPGPLVDIAVSALGDVGAVDSNFKYYQNSLLMGGWGSVDLKLVKTDVTQPLASSLDLAIDSLGRPHIVGLRQSTQELVSYDFDPVSGQWKIQSLGTGLMGTYGASIAADGKGGVGAAWVRYISGTTGSTSQLMYSYKDGNNDWSSQVITSSVYNTQTSNYESLATTQGVGITFDANDQPVISFTTISGNIFLAYDPVTVPEPTVMLLLASGGAIVLLSRLKKRMSCKV